MNRNTLPCNSVPPTQRRLPAALTAALVAVVLLAAAPAMADTMWLHVAVDEGDGGARVRVNLPLSMAETALSMVPEEEISHGKIRLDTEDISVSDLRRLWRELQDTPDATFVEVEESDGQVQVSKSGGFLLVKAHEGRGEVNVRIPAAVVDAMLSGEGEEIDLVAAIRALAEYGAGELVTVNDDETQVRVWIDDQPEMSR